MVVEDDVDRAASAVAFESLHLQGLVDDSLAAEGSVSVHDDADDLVALFVAHVVHQRLSLSKRHGVRSFEMTWVG